MKVDYKRGVDVKFINFKIDEFEDCLINVKENGSVSVLDSNKNEIYYQDKGGFWEKFEFDKNGNEKYYENSDGYWEKREFDEKNNIIHLCKSDGFWCKRKFDKNGNKEYYENSDGEIIKYINK